MAVTGNGITKLIENRDAMGIAWKGFVRRYLAPVATAGLQSREIKIHEVLFYSTDRHTHTHTGLTRGARLRGIINANQSLMADTETVPGLPPRRQV